MSFLMKDEAEANSIYVPPREDARFPIYQAIVEWEWRKWRPRYIKLLVAESRLKQSVDEMALMCVHTLQQCERRGLGADQGRELVNDLIIPRYE
jgi:hypothetical protein